MAMLDIFLFLYTFGLEFLNCTINLGFFRTNGYVHAPRGENGTDIFRPYSGPNPFRGVQICSYPSLDIQHPIPYPYPNNQITYLWCQYPIVSYPSWLTISVFESETGQKYENKYNISYIRSYPIHFHPYMRHIRVY